MIRLRNYQSWGKHRAYEALKQYRRVLYCSPTGSGKRIQIVDICLDGVRHGRRILIATNRRLLVDQMAEECHEQGVHYGVIMADYFDGDPGGPVQIASIQTIQSWYLNPGLGAKYGIGLPEFDLLIVDECFTGETEILTPTGPRRIDNVRCGDNVFTASGIGTVAGVFCKQSHDIYTITFANGNELTCTGNHPFFTDKGWVKASDMEGTLALGVQAVCGLWESVHTDPLEREAFGGAAMESSTLLLSLLCQEIQEPDEQPRVGGENACHSASDKAQTYQARRERAVAALATARTITRTWRGMGVGGCSPHRDGTRERIPYVLQDRHCESSIEDRDRVGREEPCHQGSARTGRQEDEFSGWVRVVSVSRHEPESTRTVFNLRVCGHPSYFANGTLVHNCHSQPDSYLPLLAMRPEAKCLGLTATPVGLEGRSLVPTYYDVLVEGAKNSELIAGGYLLPTTVVTMPEPDLEGVKIVNKQEYNQKQLGQRIKECVVFSDVFQEWLPYRDRKTICFVPGVDYGRDLEAQFNFMLGAKKAHLIHAGTSPTDRREVLDSVKHGDSDILISVDVLKEGFDLPVLSCLVDLQPNNQLRTYWQKLGRVKRPSGTQQRAVVIDAAGNYWKFPHPDEDPIWPEGDETTQEAIERSRKAGKASQPIMCPKCGTGYSPSSKPPKCPNCGLVLSGEPKRVIRMGTGRLKEVPAYAKAKKEKSEHDKKLGQWQSCLFMGLKAGMTFGQVSKVYHDKTGEHPKDGWPGVFGSGALGWKRRVRDDMDAKKIVLSCKRAQKP